jgi:hypothetical protein
MQVSFMVIVFIAIILDIRLQIAGIIKEMFKQEVPMWTTCNIECYKCHNYGHIASDCRSMIDTSMKENTDIIYKKVWIRKQEEQVNKDQVPEIARLAIK